MNKLAPKIVPVKFFGKFKTCLSTIPKGHSKQHGNAKNVFQNMLVDIKHSEATVVVVFAFSREKTPITAPR